MFASGDVMGIFRDEIDPNEVGYGAPTALATVSFVKRVKSPTLKKESGLERRDTWN